ncbi:MAG: Eco57I restriction-modification methylase domain-containing protein [Bacteroidales bacterium]|nr:Eco57I restriction-modification methylase domain-containing protein [Bacteroidales bacterium]
MRKIADCIVAIYTYIRKGHFALENDQRVANKGESKTYKYIIPESIRQNADLIDQKLTEIRICDPAIGSGAFPVGLLHELVNAQLVLKPHLSNAYLNKKLDGFGFQFHESINESRYVYRLKRHIIQESIYGVDIDASAIDIARLRLWLSLVVDEDDLDPIETLPNLDYKIVCGNSLISRYDIDMPIEKVFKEFNKGRDDKMDLNKYKVLVNAFMDESDHDKKEEFRTLITEIKSAFKTYFSQGDLKSLNKQKSKLNEYEAVGLFGDNKSTAEKKRIKELKATIVKKEKERNDIEQAKIYQNAIEWRFEFPNLLNDNGDFVGFDVVIGNPPYFEYKLPNQLKNQYQTYNSNEIYAFFFDKSISQLLINNGVIAFITGALYIKGMKFSSLREFLLKNTNPSYIKVVGDNVFDNVQMPTSIFIGKQGDSIWSFADYIPGYSILEMIEKETNSLDDFVLIQRGFEIGRDKVTTTKTKYPFITGSEVIPWGVKNIKYITENTYSTYKKEKKYFSNDRILIRETGSKLTCLFLNKELYSNRSLYSMILKENLDIETLKYILLVLNSEVLQYYYVLRFKSDTEIFPKIRIGQAKLLPIKRTGLIIEKGLINLVEYNSFLSKNDSLVSVFFKELANAISYELYFPDELKTVNKEILKHLGNLKPITDEMSEEKKLAIIQAEFERLYDPNHPVRNNIETLDSIEEVRIIKEALK